METSSALRSPAVEPPTKEYSAWLEVEIGLDADAIALPWRGRKKLFAKRVESCLQACERAAPGIRAKLEAHPARPFAFMGWLTTEDIRSIWPLPEVRMLADRDERDTPAPDEAGRRPYVVELRQHIQAEESAIVEVERVTVIVRATDEEEAKRIAVVECGTMPAHFMGGGYRINRRWWTAEQAYLNTIYDEERMRHGTAIIVDQTTVLKTKDKPHWRPETNVERVAYGSPKQRPKTWEWMISP